jgi:predicted nuclease with TOPRIM domain
MWKCPNPKCDRNNEEEAKFCPACGQQRPLSLEEQLAQLITEFDSLKKEVESLQKEVEELREELRRKNQQKSQLEKAWEWFKSH